MTLEDVVKELSKVYTAEDSLVLHRSYIADSSIKILKRFRYSLISAKPGRIKELYTNLYSATCTGDDLKEVWKDLDKKFLGEIFNWLKNDCGKQMSDINN